MHRKLSNSMMGKMIARFLGKETLAVDNAGKVTLTDEEKASISSQYGRAVLEKLESTVFTSEDDESNAIFEAAVAFKADALVKNKEAVIAQLQQEIATLVDESEPDPKAGAVADPKEALNFSIDPNAYHNTLATRAINTGNFAVAASGVDVDAIKAEFKTAMPAGAKLEILAKKIYQGFPDAQYMTRRQSNGKDYVGAAAIMSEVSQAFTPKWTPKGTATFTPFSIKYRRHKINVPIVPAEVIGTWLVDLYEQGKTPAQQPLVHYIVAHHIIPKVCEDITLAMIAKGKYVDPGSVQTGNAGKPASQSMDGFETILVEGKASETCKFNFLKDAKDVRTLKGQALLDYVEAFAKAISPMFRGRMPIYVSQDVLDEYKRADYAVYGKYTGDSVGNQIRFSTFSLVALESMYNSPIIFSTPKENFIELVDYSAAANCINDIQVQDYEAKIFGEYSLSVGFAVQEAVFASVPDGYTPSEVVALDGVTSDKWAHGGQVLAAASETL